MVRRPCKRAETALPARAGVQNKSDRPMLTSIRTVFSKGFARVILIALVAMLIFSFAIWGIQDVFRGFRDTELARIGNTVIQVADFQRQYNQQLQAFSRQTGQPISPDQARLLGLPNNLLGRLTTNAVLDERAKGYGLGLPLEKVATMVMEDPTFQAGTGRFNRDYFNEVLRQNGMTEAMFFQQQRNAYIRAQIGEAIAGDATPPKILQEALNRFGAETRSIDYLIVADTSLPAAAAPTDAELSAFFESRKADFKAPEYRKFAYMALSPADIAKTLVVTDEDAKADYDARKDRYTTPEKREVQQIAFPSAEEAKAAADRLASNAITFDALVAERKLTAADVSLGSVTKAQMLDPAIAEEAFKLAVNTNSGAVAGKLTNVILRVTKIEPEVTRPFEELKDEIKQEIAQSRATKEILDIQGKIEDERAGGATLKEIAPKFKLAMVEVEAGDARGLDPAGAPVTLPSDGDLLRRVFTTDMGAETDVIDARDAGFIWYEVLGITPERERTLDEAKAAVTAAFVTDQKAKALRARTDDLVKQIKAGKTLEDVAKELGTEVKQAWNLKRNEPSQGLSDDAVSAVFATQKDGVSAAAGASGSERIVFKMTGSTVPDFDPKAETAVALQKQFAVQLGDDLLAQYVLRSQSDLGTTVNQQLLNQATGVAN
jgi:peptidyl-prolyl cis-trans isomerase D